MPKDAPIDFLRFKKLMMDTGNLVSRQPIKRRLTMISSTPLTYSNPILPLLIVVSFSLTEDEDVDIKRKSMMPQRGGALLDESEVTSSWDRLVQMTGWALVLRGTH